MNEIAQDTGTPVETSAPPAAKRSDSAFASSAFSFAPLLLDVKLPMRVRMGQAKMSLRAITQLVNGSVVEMDCSVNHPVEVVVNDRVIAEGEIVIVGGNYGVRITQIAGVAAEMQLGTENELRKLSDKLK
jgi:flagellar motor switch protein FliN/FliY